MSFLSRIIAGSAGDIFLLLGDDSGIPVYYYLKASPAGKVLLTNFAADDEAVEIEKYGIIIFSGYGKPAKKIQQEMMTKYGFNAEIPVEEDWE